MSSQDEVILHKQVAIAALMTFGFISLLGDIIYEGSRGAISAYLQLLMTPALIVGLAIGLGEFLGYALRLFSGYFSDVTRAYWGFVITGYTLLISIPLLAFFTDWKIVILLVIIERVAKAIRTPARDTLLSVTTKGIGRGKAFGLHELLDQVGAVVGPLIVAIAIWYKLQQGATEIAQLQFAFVVLIIPYILLLTVLFTGYIKLKQHTKKALMGVGVPTKSDALSGVFYAYSFAVMLNAAGLFQVALILYIAAEMFTEILWIVPLLYLLIQGVDAIAAPIAGIAYDKRGRSILIAPFMLSILPTVFITLMYVQMGIQISPSLLILLAAIFYGIVLGMQESVYRAAVADLTGISKRGLGYGIFSTLYGLGFMISGAVFGYIIDLSKLNPLNIIYALVYTMIVEITATILLIKSLRMKSPKSE
ncbi:MAG: MFS transporter [Crenarchaeota archaeon]|nr:MFS transporter [Thermoproteota archaeon]